AGLDPRPRWAGCHSGRPGKSFSRSVLMLDRKTPLIAAAAIGLLVWAGQATAKDPHSEKGCAACHTPHKAHSDVSVPLWATTDHTGGDRVPTATTLTDKTTYDSPTMDAVEAGMEVTGSSILCLSCHDST